MHTTRKNVSLYSFRQWKKNLSAMKTTDNLTFLVNVLHITLSLQFMAYICINSYPDYRNKIIQKFKIATIISTALSWISGGLCGTNSREGTQMSAMCMESTTLLKVIWIVYLRLDLAMNMKYCSTDTYIIKLPLHLTGYMELYL